MKRLPIIIFAITGLGLCVLAASLVLEIRDRDRLQQSTIDGLNLKNLTEKKAFEKRFDSIERDFSRQIDSMAFAHKETLKSNARSQREISVLKNILFVTHSDSSRNIELSKLYPSFKITKP